MKAKGSGEGRGETNFSLLKRRDLAKHREDTLGSEEHARSRESLPRGFLEVKSHCQGVLLQPYTPAMGRAVVRKQSSRCDPHGIVRQDLPAVACAAQPGPPSGHLCFPSYDLLERKLDLPKSSLGGKYHLLNA